MSSVAESSVPDPTIRRVAIQVADPEHASLLRDALRRFGYVIVENWHQADAVVSDGEASLPPHVLHVALGGRAPAQGHLLKDASPEQLDAALRAVAAGLTVQSSEQSAFKPAVEFDDESVLTPREMEVLEALASGLPNKGIARHLGISLHTVKFHVESLFRKLGARNRTEAVAKALERRRLEMISL
jgi:DNA-binding CsgD family transcriptional regulator